MEPTENYCSNDINESYQILKTFVVEIRDPESNFFLTTHGWVDVDIVDVMSKSEKRKFIKLKILVLCYSLLIVLIQNFKNIHNTCDRYECVKKVKSTNARVSN